MANKKIEILPPETDAEMHTAPDHAGIESLTAPFHYRGQIFGIGDNVESVKRTIARWERVMKEGEMR